MRATLRCMDCGEPFADQIMKHCAPCAATQKIEELKADAVCLEATNTEAAAEVDNAEDAAVVAEDRLEALLAVCGGVRQHLLESHSKADVAEVIEWLEEAMTEARKG